MPVTEVIFFLDDDGAAPAHDSLRALLASGQRRPWAKCQARIARLAEKGHELRRPEADYLRDGIHELRATHRGINYRILYFFHDRLVAVLSQLITKEERVPDVEIERAIACKRRFEADPDKHTLRI